MLPLTAINKFVDAASTPCKAAGVDWRDYFSDLGEQTTSERVREEARAEARTLCLGCPVPLHCLERSYRFGRDQWGVAGGLSNLDREDAYETWAATHPTFADVDDAEGSDEGEIEVGGGPATAESAMQPDAAESARTGEDASTPLARRRSPRGARAGGDRDAAA